MGNSELRRSYDDFFAQATESSQFSKPYDYQRRLALMAEFPEVLAASTGMGKTAAVILAWLFRRFLHPDAEVRKITPRRLVYCLPMRTLVEQTERKVRGWLDNLAKHNKKFKNIRIHVLMGGEASTDWDEYPECEAIVIGTQDMLLSRALNRGYGMSRYRWPVHFGLLNNDCLWVFDETQLMGVGVTTAAQLQGLRDKLGSYGVTHSLWMSATLDESRLATVDHEPPERGWRKHELEAKDRKSVKRLIEAAKPCRKAKTRLTAETMKKGYEASLAKEIARAHQPGTLTLVVLNRVNRAQRVFSELRKQQEKNKDVDQPDVFLIHSRFRKGDRRTRQDQALEKTEAEDLTDTAGRIIVATQAIEAGVDVSATTFFTELSLWSSLVQRFGRCNRRGTCGKKSKPAAQVFWVDVDTSDAKRSLPYMPGELETSREYLRKLSDVGLRSLDTIGHREPSSIDHTLRRKDLLELWDTTPDLAGNDLDVSRYIRDSDDTDVQVFWREWDRKAEKGKPPAPRNDEGNVVYPAASREELCSVPVGQARKFLDGLKESTAWCWDMSGRSKAGDGAWRKIGKFDIRPGMILLLHVDSGGYDAELGWTGDHKSKTVQPVEWDTSIDLESRGPDSMPYDGSRAMGKEPMLLTDHLQRVMGEAEKLKKGLRGMAKDIPWKPIFTATLWHDAGKAHPACQTAMHDSGKVKRKDPNQKKLWAKSGGSGIPRYRIDEDDGNGGTREKPRRGFRHELASALVYLHHHDGRPEADLVAYLIASHHGKVRASIRSLPDECRPDAPEKRFARGIWDGDEIPVVDLGNDFTTDKIEIDLSLMELGEKRKEDGQDRDSGPSWLARTLTLRDRDDLGPFRLTYLETLVRLADWRGSKTGGD